MKGLIIKSVSTPSTCETSRNPSDFTVILPNSIPLDRRKVVTSLPVLLASIFVSFTISSKSSEISLYNNSTNPAPNIPNVFLSFVTSIKLGSFS